MWWRLSILVRASSKRAHLITNSIIRDPCGILRTLHILILPFSVFLNIGGSHGTLLVIEVLLNTCLGFNLTLKADRV